MSSRKVVERDHNSIYMLLNTMHKLNLLIMVHITHITLSYMKAAVPDQII